MNKSMPTKRYKIPWTPELLALLGKISDDQLSRRIGCSARVVAHRRRQLGIKAQYFRTSYPWGTTEIDLLRNFTDKDISRITGRSPSDIAAKRQGL
jgi:hypothetical protein